MVEQWNSDSKGWWNNGTVIVEGGGTVIVKGGGSVEQCHNLMIVRVVTRKQARCLSWILESLIDEKKNTIEGLPVIDALHLAVTRENKR